MEQTIQCGCEPPFEYTREMCPICPCTWNRSSYYMNICELISTGVIDVLVFYERLMKCAWLDGGPCLNCIVYRTTDATEAITIDGVEVHACTNCRKAVAEGAAEGVHAPSWADYNDFLINFNFWWSHYPQIVINNAKYEALEQNICTTEIMHIRQPIERFDDFIRIMLDRSITSRIIILDHEHKLHIEIFDDNETLAIIGLTVITRRSGKIFYGMISYNTSTSEINVVEELVEQTYGYKSNIGLFDFFTNFDNYNEERMAVE